MFRHFHFEEDIYCTLDCVPMTVRRKLDRIGLKVHLAQWQALGQGERLAVCHLPADQPDECQALRAFVVESVKRTCGVEPGELPPEQRQTAEPPDKVPPALVADAAAAGSALTQAMWDRLDGDERYMLTKLEKRGDKLAIALRELLAESPRQPAAK
ncbi:MAG TPA: nitrate reductase associated protein [Candidatus Binataceae bacterium]|nr:nitrate reductase associated protein [Candidatus Binataceae bacterium]